ncbi:uncharacterized protein E0L32_010356 [Thyridium curvatum]|uniref:Wax synthase domain-containing protein n=1 Tax=Thyridium curvatum TaxID=1093900 RepID=A0A507ASL6_9PEZI|nr:uncharacterized protein E0L32_010356 [Thyridium curvatum]TPX07901.1 hypothetical protein E0L32_010356 [Thyridium curvatum]
MQTFYSPTTLITWDVRAPAAMAMQSIITAFLVCTTPKGSVLRFGALPVLLLLAWVCVQTASAFSLQVMMYLGFAVCGYVNVFHCFNFLCLNPFDDADIRREMARWKSSPPNPTLFGRIYFATATIWSFRGVGTSYEIRSMPKFPGNVVPTKRSFLLQQVGWIVFQYLFMDLITSQPQPPEAAEAWAVGKEWLWLPLNPHPVTKQDLTSRLLGTLMSWYLIGKMMLDTWYRLFALIFVGLGISPCLRAPLQGVAKFITRGILRLPPSLLESYFTMLIIFILSGHFHILLDYCSGMTSWRLSGGVQCFALMVPGIMIEDCIQWLWSDFKAKSGIHGRQWLERTVGYIWTFLYLAAVTPVFNYPLQRIDRNPTYLIPWSFFKHFTQQQSTA